MKKADERELEIRSEMRQCVHFNGIQNDTCKAGVNYRSLVGGEDFGWALAIPCLGREPSPKRTQVECAQRVTPGREEAERHVDDMNTHVAEVLAALKRGEDPPGVIVCGRRTQPDGKACPSSMDGECPECGVPVEPIYGIGSGYGGIGGYSICQDCSTVYDFVEDTGE